MPQIAAYNDVIVNRKERQTPTGTAWRTGFLDPVEGDPTSPQAFLVEGVPGRVIRSHFHEHDQYQVIVSGDGVLGKHNLFVNAVHYSRSHTPYGPIVFGQGMGFLTLRAERDGGAQYLDVPEMRAKLDQVDNRRPFQVTEGPKFEQLASGSATHAFDDIKDEEGLASFSMSVAPNAKAFAPDPSATNGQYLIIVRGSLMYEGKEYKALSVVFVKSHEGRMELVAGAEGLDVLVLHFPRKVAPAVKSAAPALSNAPGTRVWQCMLCAFVYDESKGLPDEGIAPGTPWEEVPESWYCPDCSASKSEFQMAQVA
jgi:rubredoxin